MLINKTTQTASNIRKLNRQKVFQYVYFESPISRLEISARSGLSPSTVTKAVADLLEDGIVVESGAQESHGGRPRTILNINPRYGYFIGIEVGETHIHAEILDLNLKKLSQTHRLLADDENQPKEVIDHISASIETLLEHSYISRNKILGVGIGLPGIVDHRLGVSVVASNWNWQNVPLTQLLRERLKLPIRLDNGAQAMALAEWWFGAGEHVDNVAVLLIGTGVGAGIIASGQLYQGTSNSAGEWGHMCIERQGRPCRCGSRGCLEAYVGATEIISRLRELDPGSAFLACEGQVDTIRAIRDAAQGGHPLSIQILDEVAHSLGVGVANIINLFNPEIITIGGWVGLLLGDYILDRVRNYAQQYALKPAFSAARLQISPLDQEAVSIGAASLAFEEFMRTRLD